MAGTNNAFLRWSHGVAAVLAALAVLTGCGRSNAGWQTRREVYEQPEAKRPPHAAMAGGAMMPPMAGGNDLPPAASVPLKWKTPEGWTEAAGSGMRLATFAVKAETGEGSCTIVVLGGSAGGLEANVTRWIGQVGLTKPDDAAMQAFLAKQEKFKTAGGFETIAVDLGDLAPDAAATSNSMIGAIVDVDGSTCFVKLTGPSGLLKSQKARFLELCRSLDHKS